MEKHPNILATNLMKEVKTTRRLKRKLSQDLRHWAHALEDFYKFSNLFTEYCAERQLVIVPRMK